MDFNGIGTEITSFLGLDGSSSANKNSTPNQPSTPNAAPKGPIGVAAPATAQSPAATLPLTIPNLHMPTSEGDALAQSSGFDVAGFNAELGAAQQKASILQQAGQAQDDVYSDTLKAYDNLKTIERFGGEKSGPMKILGLFDSDFNADYQRTNVQEALVRGEQIQHRAETQINVIDAVPNLIAKAGTVADKLMKDRTAFDNYNLDVYKTGQQDRDLAIKRRNSNLEAARVGTEVDEDRRKQAQFRIDSMGEGDAAAALKDASTNPKSPWRDVAGLLQKHLTDSEAATANLDSAQAAAQRGDMETANMHYQQVMNNLPKSQLQGAYLQAQKTGSATVTFGKGSPNEFTVPVGYITAALNSQTVAEGQANNTLAQEAADDAKIGPTTKNLIGTASMFANADPRAGTELQVLNANVNALGDKPTYNQIVNYKALLKTSQDSLKNLVAQIAQQYPSKGAQAAVKLAGENGGRFSPDGGQAVVTDTLGSYSATQSSPYKGAWTALNTALASQLKSDQIGHGGYSSGSQPMSGADLMAALNQGRSNPKLAAIKEQVMADPHVQQQAAAAIQDKIAGDAVLSTLVRLSRQKSAAPLWSEILQTAQRTGNVDANQLATDLEKARIMSGNKVDYSQTFSSTLRNYGSAVDDTSSHDPRYAIGDRAMEAWLFGSKPHSAVVGSWLNNFNTVSRSTRAQYEQRILQDRSGQTVKQANGLRQGLGNGSIFAGSPTSENAIMPNALEDQPPTTDLNTPSATGLKLSVHDINVLTGGR